MLRKRENRNLVDIIRILKNSQIFETPELNKFDDPLTWYLIMQF